MKRTKADSNSMLFLSSATGVRHAIFAILGRIGAADLKTAAPPPLKYEN